MNYASIGISVFRVPGMLSKKSAIQNTPFSSFSPGSWRGIDVDLLPIPLSMVDGGSAVFPVLLFWRDRRFDDDNIVMVGFSSSNRMLLTGRSKQASGRPPVLPTGLRTQVLLYDDE